MAIARTTPEDKPHTLSRQSPDGRIMRPIPAHGDEATKSPGNQRREFLILVCTSVPSFMLQLDANIVSVSLPAIARSLNASFAGIEWVITAYILTFASLLMPAGALSDRYGRKAILVVGLSVFTLASFLCGAAPSLPVLIAARALQGAGAAMQLSSALATLSHAFQGPARARAFAFWGTVIGIGMALGPVVGGLITQAFGWEWAFYVNVPIGIGLVVLIVQVIDSSRDPHAIRLDIPGVVCFGTALFLTTLALIEGNRLGWTDRQTLAELLGALLLFILFVVVEKREARPMLDLAFFRNPTFVGANIAQFSFAAGVLTMLTFVPIFLQNGLGDNAAHAGLMMLPMVIPLFVVPRIVSRHLAARLSGRSLLTLGLAVVAVGLVWFAVVVPRTDYTAMIGAMLLVGSGAGILNGETTKVNMMVIPKERSGMASGLAGTVRFSGLVLGISALGAVLYGRVAVTVAPALPLTKAADSSAIIQAIAAGHFQEAVPAGHGDSLAKAVALGAYASGYQWLFATGAAFIAVAALLTWMLVSAEDTPPAGATRNQ